MNDDLCKKIFDELDDDHDGKIDIYEQQDFISSRARAFSSGVGKAYYYSIVVYYGFSMITFDKDFDEQLSFEEFIEMEKVFNQIVMSCNLLLRFVFDSIDTDHDGIITLDELQDYTSRVNMIIQEDYIKDVFDKFFEESDKEKEDMKIKNSWRKNRFIEGNKDNIEEKLDEDEQNKLEGKINLKEWIAAFQKACGEELN